MASNRHQEDIVTSTLCNNQVEVETSDKRRNAKQWFMTIWDNGHWHFGIEKFHEGVVGLENMEKYVLQEEKCPKSGKRHMQALILFSKQYRMVPQFEKIFGLGWYRPAINKKQAIQYCTKSESRVNGPWCWSSKPDDGWEKECDTDGSFSSKKKEKEEKEKKTVWDGEAAKKLFSKLNLKWDIPPVGEHKDQLTLEECQGTWTRKWLCDICDRWREMDGEDCDCGGPYTNSPGGSLILPVE